MNPNEFLAFLRTHAFEQSDDTLRVAYNILGDAMKLNSAKMAVTFKPGDRVAFKGKYGMTEDGVVQKVNRTSLNVKADDGVVWRVYAAACTKSQN